MIINILIQMVKSLKIIHVGSMVAKIKASFKLGFLLSLPTFIWDQISNWGLNNYEYLLVVMTAVAIDHILGTFKHLFIDKDFTFRKNITGVAVKIGLVVAIGFLFEGLNIIFHRENIIKDYLTIMTRLIVFLYPAGSAFANSSVITHGKFPPSAWLDRLERFKKNLNPNEFKDDNKNEKS